MLDRLLHHAPIVSISGESYRLQGQRKAGQTGRRTATVCGIARLRGLRRLPTARLRQANTRVPWVGHFYFGVPAPKVGQF